MTQRETQQIKELSDIIVEKLRNLFALENRILEARDQATQIVANRDTAEPTVSQDPTIPEDPETLTTLETQLKEQIEEMEEMLDELRSETPSLRTYVLPQVREIVETLKVSDAAEQKGLTQLIATLTDDGDTQSLEQLEVIIITRLRDNLEKTFGP